MARAGPRPGASGRAVLDGVLRALRGKEGWPPGLTVLTGDDLFHLDAAWRAILAYLAPQDADGFAVTCFGADPVPPGDVIAAARSVGMFHPRRVVLVRELSALTLDSDASVEAAREGFARYAADPPPGSFLLVRAPKLDVRRRFHKALAASGRLLAFPALEDDAGLVSEVRGMARERALDLDEEAAAFLADLCAGDLYRIDSELEKLRLWVGGAGAAEVTAEGLQDVVAGGGRVGNFEVADAVARRDAGAALGLARRAIDDGTEPLLLFGALAWKARAMLQAKALLASGASEHEARSAARLRDLSPLSRWRLHELLAFPARLLQADRALKSRSIDPRAVLESLLDDLMRPPAPAEHA